MNGRTDKRQGENYIPRGINAGGIKNYIPRGINAGGIKTIMKVEHQFSLGPPCLMIPMICDSLWMRNFQQLSSMFELYNRMGYLARAYFEGSMKHCPNCIFFWNGLFCSFGISDHTYTFYINILNELWIFILQKKICHFAWSQKGSKIAKTKNKPINTYIKGTEHELISFDLSLGRITLNASYWLIIHKQIKLMQRDLLFHFG